MFHVKPQKHVRGTSGRPNTSADPDRRRAVRRVLAAAAAKAQPPHNRDDTTEDWQPRRPTTHERKPAAPTAATAPIAPPERVRRMAWVCLGESALGGAAQEPRDRRPDVGRGCRSEFWPAVGAHGSDFDESWRVLSAAQPIWAAPNRCVRAQPKQARDREDRFRSRGTHRTRQLSAKSGPWANISGQNSGKCRREKRSARGAAATPMRRPSGCVMHDLGAAQSRGTVGPHRGPTARMLTRRGASGACSAPKLGTTKLGLVAETRAGSTNSPRNPGHGRPFPADTPNAPCF